MNVKLNEFIVASRASHILGLLRSKNMLYQKYNGAEANIGDLSFMTSISAGECQTTPEDTVELIHKNLSFFLSTCIPGLNMSTICLVRESDKTIEPIQLLEFTHTRRDNGEVINVKLAAVVTETDILLVSPFNSPDLQDKLKSPNGYVISMMATNDLNIPSDDKTGILKLIDARPIENSRVTNVSRIMDIIDAIATSIHMQMEYIVKDLDNVQDTDFKVITKESKEFQMLYSKYGDAITPELDVNVPVTDFLPIMISEEDMGKLACMDSQYHDKVGVEHRLAFALEYSDITKPIPSGMRCLLVQCPETSVPLAIKLPEICTYVSFNRIRANGGVECNLIDPENPIACPSLVQEVTAGTEAVDMAAVKNMLKDLRVYGISSGTKMYEMLAPIMKLPNDLMKTCIQTIKSVFSSKAAIERESSEQIKEKLLNDELDSMFEKFDLILRHIGTVIVFAFIIGNVFIALVAYLLLKGDIDDTKLKAYERVERSIVSKIRIYNKKIEFATQESDYKNVKILTVRRDSYKTMLDKLRDVKASVSKKTEKYSDTFSEYSEEV